MEEKDFQSTNKSFEPTIADIEWVINEFRKNHGEAELSALLQDFTMQKSAIIEKKEITDQEVKKELIKITEENLIQNFLQKVRRVHPKKEVVVNETTQKTKEFALKILKNKYFKRISIFLGLYLIIYLAMSAPMYLERMKYAVDSTETIKVLSEEIVRTPMADSAPLDPGEAITPGQSLIVPKLGITAPIVNSKSANEAEVQADLKNGVAKFAGTANPGQVGNTFITGHSSGYFWDKSAYKYVFTNLDRLIIGDQAKIYSNNKKYVYQVVEKKIVEPTDVSVIKATDEPYLTLMTCFPPGTSSKRLIVKMKQISPEYIKPKVIMKETELEVPKTLPTSDTRNIFERMIFFWE